jgi:Ca2+/Na+ antiporter
MCGKRRPGIPVESDYVIEAIRWFKRNVTKDEQKNRLVVCKNDYPKYKKNRDRYTLRRFIYLSLGAVFVVLGLLLSFRIGTLLAGFAVLIFLYLISLMNYTPKLRIEVKTTASKKAKA